MPAPLLLPTPRHASWSGQRVPWPSRPTASGVPVALAAGVGLEVHEAADGFITAVRDPRCPPQAYRLELASTGVRLVHSSDAGLRHACATLAQLVVDGELPLGQVADEPWFPTRGFMLDISRDRVPTIAFLLDLASHMARLKLNHLQLYTEHTLAYAGHQDAWAAASPLTLDELAQLDRHCAGLGIELAANQNCFGHCERWFAHERYRGLAELPDRLSTEQMDPRCLSPAVPASLDLTADLLAQQCGRLASGLVNIGGDETWDLGQGRSRDLVRSYGYGAVYGRFLGQVMAQARALGRRPLFWADMVEKHPESAVHLDREALPIAWGYGARHDFAASLQRLRGIGFDECWVAPGTACWLSFGGYADERGGNLLQAARQGIAAGATGFLCTCWGDRGHRQPWAASLAALAEAAHRAWAGADPYDTRAASRLVFGDRDLGVAAWLDAWGMVDRPLRDGRRWETLFNAWHQAPGNGADAAEWRRIRRAVEQLAEERPALPDALRGEVRMGLAAMGLAADRAIRARDGSPIAQAGPRFAAVLEEFRACWLRRSGPGGLADSLARFGQPDP